MAGQSDNDCLNTRTPCSCQVYFQAKRVRKGTQPSLWQVWARGHESMTGVISLMSKLVAPASAIVVPGVDDVLPIADAEEQRATLCMSIEPVTDISL